MIYTFIATTSMGFESVLGHELRALNFKNIKVHDTKVEFDGSLSDLCKANLWCRTAGRIYVKLAQFKATTFDDLFEQTYAIPWESWIQPSDQFPITDVSSRKSTLFSKSSCQSIVKKAIVKKLLNRHRCTSLPETDALVSVRIQIDNDQVVLSIDSSGEGLHKRGYRAHMHHAPLRETLAAGLILLSRWRPDKDALIDPFCGSGTILIEAGLIACNIAPGLHRQFAAEHWSIIPQSHWTQCREEAQDAIIHDAPFRIFGSDQNGSVLSIARKNIEKAGLSNIFVQKRDIAECASRFDTGKIITNPPYGERLSDSIAIDDLYEQMGDIFRSNFPSWSYYILTSYNQFERLFGQASTKHRKLYNGGIKCFFYEFFN